MGDAYPGVVDGRITSIQFRLATDQAISRASISDCPINHPSQLTNPFLGLPLELGKCESCGTAEPGKCDGHFGYIQLPIPIYHPCHISELRKLLSLICLKCLRIKNGKMRQKDPSVKTSSAPCSNCIELPQISVREHTTKDGARYLELRVSSKSRFRDGFWNFLDRYGYRYGDKCRQLLPCEVLEILKRLPEDTKKRLSAKGYFPQEGYILQKLPVPPNCLSVPDVSDGKNIMSSDVSISMLKKVLKQVDIIKNSRSGPPSFEAHEIEANDLQLAVAEYLNMRGVAKQPHIANTRSGTSKEADHSSTRVWVEKMRTLFIRKGSGFSSRSVLSGDTYKRVNEIGLPLEIAQRITFEEKVTERNQAYLQDLVDKKLCLTYRDGASTYSLREGSKGHTFLRVGQLVHRRIMDGDIVFINRTPSTHKHSLQAFSIYVHDDHTVKINPLICGPFGADFDGDCIQLYYPQSLAAKAEAVELFSVEQQLLSSHSGNLNLQLVNDALLSLKIMFKVFFFDKATAQQLVMSLASRLQGPAVLKLNSAGSRWTVLQILQSALPSQFDCVGDRHLIFQSEILRIDFNRDMLQSTFNEIISSVFFKKGSKEALEVFNSLQPLLMENIFLEGFSISLRDLSIPKSILVDIQKDIQRISPLLHDLRFVYDELVEMQVENHLRSVKVPVINYILKSSALADIIDSKSESSLSKLVQQLGFLGLQLSDRGKYYSKTLVDDMTALFHRKYSVNEAEPPPEAFGLIRSSLFHGLDPYEEMVHSISSREVLIRSSRGLAEPGTLFKNLMAILRDVIICYDGTVRNACSNFLIQFKYEAKARTKKNCLHPAGEAVGVLAATAISNPAYKAVLDSTPSSNLSWDLMKEILLCRVNFKNDPINRRVILYLNDCNCGKKYCKEKAAYIVLNCLKRFSLKDIAITFLIEHQKGVTSPESSLGNSALVGHIHLDKKRLKELNLSMHEVLLKCQETISSGRKKKKDPLGPFLKRIFLSVSECCCFQQSCDSGCAPAPCLQFSWQDTSIEALEKLSRIMANIICPVLLETIVKGDPRVDTASIIWVSSDASTWVKNPGRMQKGELALDVVLNKAAVKVNGDAWRTVMDCCLPVFHLIDTKRSIPYAIKQVQELVGISCAFIQVVERLSRAVKMVAKGVLNEHLLLLGNTMTCSGNLIGFYVGGYKALFRCLKVHVPFTEATLFTPRKCFERAAEKCHIDSLSSIVASCSWGKHVAVGTGARFEILWNNKEIDSKQDGVEDVFNFLHLVRMNSNGRQFRSTCLGGEIDDLEILDREVSLSPEHNPDYGCPTFDDVDDTSQCDWEKKKTAHDENINKSNWEINSFESDASKKVEGDKQWNSKNAAVGTEKVSAWSSWSTDRVQKQDHSVAPSGESPSSGGWNNVESQKGVSNSWNTAKSQNVSNAWNNVESQKGVNNSSNAAKTQNVSNAWNVESQNGVSNAWNSVKSQEVSNAWNNVESQKGASSGWNSIESQEVSNAWNNVESHKDISNAWSKQIEGETTNKIKDDGKVQWGQWKKSHDSDDKLLEEQASQSTKGQLGAWSSWDANTSQAKSNLTAKSLELPKSTGWNDVGSQKRPDDGWGKQDQTVKATGWGNKEKKAEWGQWNKSSESDPIELHSQEQQELPLKESSVTNLIEEQVNQDKNIWDSSGGTNGSQNEVRWGAHKDSFVESPAWDKERSQSHGWDTDDKVDQGKKQTGSRGWDTSNSSGWKLKKSQRARSPGKLDDQNDRNTSGIFTATRQRLDQFTSEEQDVLSDVEPIMHSIRRIMHQTRDKDGEPLPPDDQSYVLDNVLNHHPDKVAKMGDGVDYIMVNKHSSYQESRCFYVVSTDGRKEDFSYRKCLENFIKTKHPDIAVGFISKYFRRSHSAAGGREGAGGQEGGQE